jgi:hypothetical protein
MCSAARGPNGMGISRRAVTGKARHVNQNDALAEGPALTRAKRGRLHPLVRPRRPTEVTAIR